VKVRIKEIKYDFQLDLYILATLRESSTPNFKLKALRTTFYYLCSVKKLQKILRFVTPYWKHVILTVFFNILSVIFNVVSLVFFIPVLNILFDKQKFFLHSK